MSTLYQLTGEFLELLAMMQDSEEDTQVILDTLEGLEYEVEVKAENYAKIIKEIEISANGIREEIKRLTARATSLENKAKILKSNLEQCMITTGKKKFKTDLFSFSIQKNPAKVIYDSDIVNPRFLIEQAPKIDTTAVKEALKNGEILEFAHLEQSESLRIR